MSDGGTTRPAIRVAALLTTLAFAGIFVVVLAMVLGGNNGVDPRAEQLAAAREAVAARPADPAAWAALASAEVGDQDLPAAVRAAERAHRLAPGAPEHMSTLATLLAQDGRLDDAVRVAERYTARRPADAEGHLLLAQLADRQGDRPKIARLAYATFLDLQPDDPLAAEVRDRLAEIAPDDGAVADARTGAPTPDAPATP
ncbi:MAG: tetratricopeptide repeat protein [Thermoleophilia bacterium]|jgi:predicted Zn-dependent protease|nr:tetratricopeptide repeat protein [Thermoleophilia bacterium]